MLSKVISRASSIWTNVPQGPPDPILGISEAFKRDTNPRKVNLGVGAYRDDDGKPWILPSVKKAKEILINANLDHEYLPTEGLNTFRQAAALLAYGNCPEVAEGRIAALQALSGTGALRIGCAFISRFYPHNKIIYVPKPTWGNHKNIARDAGLEVREYSYYCPTKKGLDFERLLSEIDEAPRNSIILLHACAHNPTGQDPSHEQWAQIHEVITRKQHLAFFDTAYQGFASGSTDEDAYGLRYFVKEKSPVLLAQSFAKNFGLYGERIGLFTAVTDSSAETDRVVSQLKILGRAMYSNPPLYGARIVSTVLNTPELYRQWQQDLVTMSGRIKAMRSALVEKLKEKGSPHDWSHITNQIGMFAFTGLNAEQSQTLMTRNHVYLTLDGRISIAGLNTKNVEYVADAIETVTRNTAKI
ncbi:unnamed protein product [Blepharisma stoltei]|uniref:Aspartate aminotransferase n=1 Tax=Blepharisma stoltei TaxID=1481888 RepID=A0AAU9JWZ5_9CILI|nr:unnamed protein product [Blepharisma stoltei]